MARATILNRLLPRRSLPRAAVIALSLCLPLGAGLWFAKDSSLLAVKEVTIIGLSGPQAGAIERNLRATVIGMPTLSIDDKRLQAAVADYSTVSSLSVSGSPPNRARIDVKLRLPVATLVGGKSGAARTPVAADGHLLTGMKVDGTLPQVPARTVAGGNVGDRKTIAALRAVEAAPAALRRQIAFAGVARDTGVTIKLRRGPTLYFGGSERLRAKWAAAAVVIADPQAGAATYLDVRYPERPAAGGLKPTTNDSNS